MSFSELISAELPFSKIFNEKGDVVDRKQLANLKSARIANFLAVPFKLENLIWFGFWVCLDNFLWPFTILPLHMIVIAGRFLRGQSSRLTADEYHSAARFFLIVITSLLMRNVDASRLYHFIRGQSALKLYVIYNSLEICDKLCCAFGHDIMDALFSVPAYDKKAQSRSVGPVARFIVGVAYLFIHTLTLSAMLATLNVAINSYSNSLLTLLMSNQFVELKSAVFKRYERENVFQMSSSDIIERFQMCLFLLMILCRNLLELYPRSHWAAWDQINSASLMSLIELLGQLLTPIMIVWVSEVLVDWLKHSFICKFNSLDSKIYNDCKQSLERNLMGLGIVASQARTDVSSAPLPYGSPKTFVKASNYIAKRIGFISLPLVCLCVRVCSQLFDMMFSHRFADDDSFDSDGYQLSSGASFIEFFNSLAMICLRFYQNPSASITCMSGGKALRSMASWTAYIVGLLVFWIFLLGLKLSLSFKIYRSAYESINLADSKHSMTSSKTQSTEMGALAKRQATDVNNVLFHKPLAESTDLRRSRMFSLPLTNVSGNTSNITDLSPEVQSMPDFSKRPPTLSFNSPVIAQQTLEVQIPGTALGIFTATSNENMNPLVGSTEQQLSFETSSMNKSAIGGSLLTNRESLNLNNEKKFPRFRSRTVSSGSSSSLIQNMSFIGDEDDPVWDSSAPEPARPQLGMTSPSVRRFTGKSPTGTPSGSAAVSTSESPVRVLKVVHEKQTIDFAFGRVEFGRSQSQMQNDAGENSAPAKPQSTSSPGTLTTQLNTARRASTDVTRLDSVDRFTMYKSRIV